MNAVLAAHAAFRGRTGLVLDARSHHILPQACWSPASGAWARECARHRDGAEKEETWLIFATIRPVSRLRGTRAGAAIDEGLRAYMLKVYNLMALGLAITGVAAYGTIMLATTSDPLRQSPRCPTARC